MRAERCRVTRNLKLPLFRPPPQRGDCISGVSNTGSRADRLAGRVRCQALYCRHNLDRSDAEDVPGRRRPDSAPEWTVNAANVNASSPSCSLDIAELGPQRCSVLAEKLGIHRRRVQQEVRAAVFVYKDKLIAAGIEVEVVRDTIEQMLRAMEADKR